MHGPLSMEHICKKQSKWSKVGEGSHKHLHTAQHRDMGHVTFPPSAPHPFPMPWLGLSSSQPLPKLTTLKCSNNTACLIKSLCIGTSFEGQELGTSVLITYIPIAWNLRFTDQETRMGWTLGNTAPIYLKCMLTAWPKQQLCYFSMLGYTGISISVTRVCQD